MISGTKSLVAAAGFTFAAAALASAQSYTVVDLTPTTPNSIAYGISASGAGGYVAASASQATARATFWDGANQLDLHPAFLDNAASGSVGRSSVQGVAGNVQVGWGVGSITGNRLAPILWQGSAASATLLTIPFANAGGTAQATDGIQAVGYGTPLIRDGTTFGPARAIVWDVATGAATDLGDGGGGAQAYGVGGGKQVGYVVKGAINAALWSGTSKSLLILHPKNAVTSQAFATDGARQVGTSGYDIRVRVEAANGNKDTRFNYATVWTGSAASAINIHPYPFTHSYATAVSGSWIAGYAADQSKVGTAAYFHAIAWDANNQATDLNAFLPAGFVGAQAYSVDAQGNVAGYMIAADGTRHAVIWAYTPAP